MAQPVFENNLIEKLMVRGERRKSMSIYDFERRRQKEKCLSVDQGLYDVRVWGFPGCKTKIKQIFLRRKILVLMMFAKVRF